VLPELHRFSCLTVLADILSAENLLYEPSMEIRRAFFSAVRDCVALPASVRNAASTALGVEESRFDSTYLDFLDQQVELNARGDEWSDRLRRRRARLADWCDCPLIHGRIVVGADEYTVQVDARTQTVIYWEEYPGVHEAGGRV
jgi:hypothetical protein